MMVYEGSLYDLTTESFNYTFKYPFLNGRCLYLLNGIKAGNIIEITPEVYTATKIAGRCNIIPTSVSFRVMGKYI